MEEPDADWDIQGYSTEGRSREECGILNKGLRLGKKILVTGFVLSSAPVVIPPLAFVSALGVAVSVPFGLYLASYTCTEKIMSKLLSTPLNYPSLLDNGHVSYDGEEVISDRDAEKGDVFAVEDEEKEWMEDTRGGVEIRLDELGEKRKEDQADRYFSPNNGYEQDASTESERETDKEGAKGYEEDVGGEVVVENLPVSTGVNAEVQGPEAEEVRIPEESREGERQFVSGAVINVIEGDERKLSDPREAIEFPIEVTTVLGESTCLPTISSAGVDDFRRETTELIEKIRDEGRSDKLPKDSKQSVSEVHQYVKRDDSGTSDHAKQPEMPSKDKKSTGKSANVDNISRKKQKRRGKSEAMHEGVRKNDDRADNLQGNQSQEGRRTRVLSNADAKIKGDGSGLQLPVAKIEGSQEPSEKVSDSSKENPINLGEESTDVSEIPVSTDMSVSEEAKKVPLTKDAATMSKEILNEEKVWERISAVKIIVGYKAEPHPTCLEELRALYVFTGVEPPASLNDASDLGDINDKLQFLMSIVGVK